MSYKNQHPLLELSEANLFLQIERFVERVRKGSVRTMEFPEAFLNLLCRFNAVYDPTSNYTFSARIQLFVKLVNEVSSVGSSTCLEFDLRDEAFVQMLMDRLQQGSKLVEHADKQQQVECDRNAISLKRYLDCLMTHYSKLLLVRVDLSYKNECAHQISLVTFDADIKRLLEYIRNRRQCFEGAHGFVWVLEQGEVEGGYHCHLLLIYGANKSQSGWYYADQAGRLWRQITRDKGLSFNCHDSAYIQKFVDKGTYALDVVSRDDSAKRYNVIKMVNYLVKNKQHLCAKSLGRKKTFGHGKFKTKSRRGTEQTLYSQYKDLRDDF